MPLRTIKKVLVANRGEIALRVMSTCRALGIRTVAIYSQPDARSPFVRFADEAVCLGGTTASENYLNMDAIINAAKITNADAIHPGTLSYFEFLFIFCVFLNFNFKSPSYHLTFFSTSYTHTKIVYTIIKIRCRANSIIIE